MEPVCQLVIITFRNSVPLVLLFYAANLFLISTVYTENVECIGKWKKVHNVKLCTCLSGTNEQVFFLATVCLCQNTRSRAGVIVASCFE
jgi:hypothetical protein